MRLIDADRLANKINTAISIGKITDMPTGELEAVLNDVQNAPTIKPPTWVPCGEQLPNTHTVCSEAPEVQMDLLKHYYLLSDPVLVQTSSGEMKVAMYEDDLDGRTYWVMEDCRQLDAVAWMPLPEPYEGRK